MGVVASSTTNAKATVVVVDVAPIPPTGVLATIASLSAKFASRAATLQIGAGTDLKRTTSQM
jgi:hypothetical protein